MVYLSYIKYLYSTYEMHDINICNIYKDTKYTSLPTYRAGSISLNG